MYRATADRVLAYCLRHAGPDLAEDVVSETYTAAWRHGKDLGDEPLPWLVTVARNKIRDAYRSSARRRESLDDGARLMSLASLNDSPEATVVDRTTLLTALSRLPEKHREALLLVSWDGLTVAQAAQVMGVSRVTFSSRLHRARARLTAALAPASSSDDAAEHRLTARAAVPTPAKGS